MINKCEMLHSLLKTFFAQRLKIFQRMFLINPYWPLIVKIYFICGFAEMDGDVSAGGADQKLSDISESENSVRSKRSGKERDSKKINAKGNETFL